jgi:hypothetical protein
MKGLSLLAAAAVVVVAVSAGCGSSSSSSSSSPPTNVQLKVNTASTGGKALVFTAKADQKLASQKGGLYAMELRGVSADSSFDHPTYVNQSRCVGGATCEWTVAPAKAGTYEYRIALLDLVHNGTAGQSNTVHVKWAGAPRPERIKLVVNGKTPPSVPLTDDDYSNFAAGPMDVKATWANDAQGTGYYVRISVGNEVLARCSSGTSCPVSKKLPLGAGAEVSWTVELVTTDGNKVAGGFKTCLEGAAKHKKASA